MAVNHRKEIETMTILDIFPVLVAALFVLLVIVLKVSTMRANSKRKARGEKPLTEEPEILNVIDWTRRR